MRVFILEDDPARVEGFMAALAEHEVTHAIDVDSAIKRWQPPYDLLLLDHDLGGEHYVDSGNSNTGAAFCRWLAGAPNVNEASELIVIIHSYNGDGARNMQATLNEGCGWKAYHVMFGRELLKWLRGQWWPAYQGGS